MYPYLLLNAESHRMQKNWQNFDVPTMRKWRRERDSNPMKPLFREIGKMIKMERLKNFSYENEQLVAPGR